MGRLLYNRIQKKIRTFRKRSRFGEEDHQFSFEYVAFATLKDTQRKKAVTRVTAELEQQRGNITLIKVMDMYLKWYDPKGHYKELRNKEDHYTRIIHMDEQDFENGDKN